MRFLAYLGGDELIVVSLTALFSRSQGLDLKSGMLLATLALLFVGVFGFLFGGSSGVVKGQPWNPYYANGVARGIREEGSSRIKAGLIVPVLAGILFQTFVML